MAECDTYEKLINNNLPMDEKLPINLLAGIFNNKSESYKLFWFKAIVDAVCEGKEVISYDELLNRMISEAWYMVSEFRLNLGPSDAIERIIQEMEKHQNLKPGEKKVNIIRYLNEYTDKDIKKLKDILTLNVPYRLQSPFIGHLNGIQWRNYEYVTERVKTIDRALYYYEKLNNTKHIRMNDIWIEYIKRNQVILKGWIQNELIKYLQRRNPNVPGIPLKLEPEDTRQLEKAKRFWKVAVQNWDIEDVYTGEQLNDYNFSVYGKVDIDHFIPWSYVASDEMWNLTPTFSSINRSKSNYLPGRDKDFDKIAQQQYKAFVISNENSEMKKLFNSYQDNNLNSYDVKVKLYNENIKEVEFCKVIINLIKPVYLSASNMGFEDWKYRSYEK